MLNAPYASNAFPRLIYRDTPLTRLEKRMIDQDFESTKSAGTRAYDADVFSLREGRCRDRAIVFVIGCIQYWVYQ